MCICTLEECCELFRKAIGTGKCKKESLSTHGDSFDHDGDRSLLNVLSNVEAASNRIRIPRRMQSISSSPHILESSTVVVDWVRSPSDIELFRKNSVGAHSPNRFERFECRRGSVVATEHPEWPEENAHSMARGRTLMRTLAMDSTRFTSGDLCGLLLELFKEAGLPEEVPLSSVKRLILAVREHMYDNPYHNWAHVFDVTQTIYVLATMTGTIKRMDAWDRFALLAAALCHDLQHPGVDKGFVENAALGDAFRDKLLEKHHTLRAFQIMADSEIGVLQGISTARYYAFRQAVSGCILATCYANHSEYVAKLVALGGERGVASTQFEMELLIKVYLKA